MGLELKTSVLILLYASLITVRPAGAGVTATTKGVKVVEPPPPKVDQESAVDDHNIVVFHELYDFCLPKPLVVDAKVPGLHYGVRPCKSTLSLKPTIAINSYFLHADQTGTTVTPYSGRIDFDDRVIALIFCDTNLDASDTFVATSGVHSVVYPKGLVERGLEFTESIRLLPSRKSVVLNWSVSAVADQVRIISRAMDHFLVYEVDPTETMTESVTLQGQFDLSPTNDTITEWAYLATPVSKNGCEIARPDRHFSWYRIEQSEIEPERTISIYNQFSSQDLVIGDPEFLMVQAQVTSGKAPRFPLHLSHYKCYRVISGESAKAQVTLEDEFATYSTTVTTPLYFCVPVTKFHNGVLSPIENATDHFTVYEVDTKERSLNPLNVIDQFKPNLNTPHVASPSKCTLLCVPTLKHSWKATKS